MELRALQQFIHLAESLHFGQTSEALHVSPSTLSRTIQRLEQEAKIILFERDNRSVTLTEAGKAYLLFARNTLDGWQDFKQQTQSDSNALSGQLKLFCSVTASYSHLPPILDKLHQAHPSIDIKLETGDASLAIQKVINSEVDVALSAKPNHLPTNIAFSSFDQIPISLIGPNFDCAVGMELNKAKPDWQSLPFILAEGGLTRQRAEQWFRALHIKPNVYATVSGHEAIVSMVALGLGIGLAPDIVIANSPVRERIQRLEAGLDITPFELGVCARNKHLLNPLVKAFWQQATNDNEPSPS